MAPEIYMNKPYNGNVVDLFATGVLLFGIIFGNLPFFKAIPTDSYYKMIAGNRLDLFWKIHKNKLNEDLYPSENLIDLLSRMLGYFSVERPSIAEIREHPWWKEDPATLKEINQEFNNRFQLLYEEALTNTQECIDPEDNFDSVNNEEVHRGVDSINSDDFELGGMMEYIPECTKVTSFWSTSDPETLLKVLIEFCLSHTSEISLNKDTYTVKFRISHSFISSPPSNKKSCSDAEKKVNIQVKILKFKDKDKYWVEALPESGNRLLFNQTYALLKNFFGGHVNSVAEDIE